ncbi:MAG: hypothetical protein ACYTFZ_09965, partial [Planctomycetota bacterium]
MGPDDHVSLSDEVELTIAGLMEALEPAEVRQNLRIVRLFLRALCASGALPLKFRLAPLVLLLLVDV